MDPTGLSIHLPDESDLISHQADLLALNLCVTPAEADPFRAVPAWWGKAIHHMLIDAAAQSSTHRAGKLHAGKHQLRQFTASSLLGYQSPDDLLPGQRFGIRITALTRDVSTFLLDAMAPGGVFEIERHVELDHIPFRVISCSVENQVAHWQELRRYTSPKRQLILDFISPTTFANKSSFRRCMPEPVLVFHSLQERWRACGWQAFPPEDFLAYVEKNVILSSADMRILTIPAAPRIYVTGFQGRVAYTVLGRDQEMKGWLHTLAQFGNYSGVGAKVSWGFGQCRYDGGKEES